MAYLGSYPVVHLEVIASYRGSYRCVVTDPGQRVTLYAKSLVERFLLHTLTYL